MKICKEMRKLRQYLDDKGIKWKDASTRQQSDLLWHHFGICRTHFEINGIRWSVVNGYGTYGGSEMLDGKNQDLLELITNSVNNGKPIGYLTADDVVGYIEEAIEIVKQGGASDDVCEWELDGVYIHSPHNKPFVTCLYDYEDYRYHYCPVCGKKIKVVE